MTNDILWEIRKLGNMARDPNLTGWNNWPHKQDLYRIYWAVKKELERSPNIVGEDEWVREHDQDVFIEKLEGKY